MSHSTSVPSRSRSPFRVRRPTFRQKTVNTDVNILVMGCTGSGKTTFTNVVSGSELREGAGLESCTDIIQRSQPFKLDGYNVTIVDTPGFDDTNKSDVEIVNLICGYLREEYVQHREVHGVLYFHRITDNRLGGSGLKSLHFFQNLVGPDALKNCVLVTNMWNQVNIKVGEDRENELKSKDMFFKSALDRGATTMRHNGGQAAGFDIIRHVLRNKPAPLAIQKELVTEKKMIYETVAGQVLLGEMAEMEKKHQRELDALKKELDEAIEEHDRQAEEEIQESTQRITQDQARLVNERTRLLGGGETGGDETGEDEGDARRRRTRKRDILKRILKLDSIISAFRSRSLHS